MRIQAPIPHQHAVIFLICLGLVAGCKTSRDRGDAGRLQQAAAPDLGYDPARIDPACSNSPALQAVLNHMVANHPQKGEVCENSERCGIALEVLTTGEKACYNGNASLQTYSTIKWPIFAAADDMGLRKGYTAPGLPPYSEVIYQTVTHSQNTYTGHLLSYLSMFKTGQMPGHPDYQSVDYVNAFLKDKVGVSSASRMTDWENSDIKLFYSSIYPNEINRITPVDAVKFLRHVWFNQLVLNHQPAPAPGPGQSPLTNLSQRANNPELISGVFEKAPHSFIHGAQYVDQIYNKVGHNKNTDLDVTGVGGGTYNDLGLVRLKNGHVLALAVYNQNLPGSLAETGGQEYKTSYVACGLTRFLSGHTVDWGSGCIAW